MGLSRRNVIAPLHNVAYAGNLGSVLVRWRLPRRGPHGRAAWPSSYRGPVWYVLPWTTLAALRDNAGREQITWCSVARKAPLCPQSLRSPTQTTRAGILAGQTPTCVRGARCSLRAVAQCSRLLAARSYLCRGDTCCALALLEQFITSMKVCCCYVSA